MSRRKKPLTEGKPGHLSVAVPSELLIGVDIEAERRSRRAGYTIRRSDVVKAALHQFLRARAAAR